MPGLIDVLNVRFFQPYYYIILVATLVVIFIIAGYYAYNWYYVSEMTVLNEPTNDIANGEIRNKELLIQLFTVDWCPHCKTAKPEWVKFCNEYNGKVINGYQVSCDEKGTNCTDDKNPDIAYILSTNKIESYPTVIMFKDTRRFDFDAKISDYTLGQFVNTIANE